MVYISMLNEASKYAKILATMEKSDSLLLLYSTGNDQVSLSLVNAFKETKGKVIFDEIKPLKSLNEEIAIAYRLGGLKEKYGAIEVVSDNKILLELLKNHTVSSSGKATSSPKKKIAKSVKSDPLPEKTVIRRRTKKAESEISPLPKEGTRISSSDTRPKNIEKTSKKNNRTRTAAEGTFEYEIQRLENLCESVKTKTFNPIDYMSSISKAVQDAIRDNTKLKDKVSLYFSPNIAKLVLTSFKDKEKELFDIVEKMHSLDV